jgi:hypothetical protein
MTIQLVSGRHNEFRRGPTFFRSGKRWWRDDGHGNQTEAIDVNCCACDGLQPTIKGDM